MIFIHPVINHSIRLTPFHSNENRQNNPHKPPPANLTAVLFYYELFPDYNVNKLVNSFFFFIKFIVTKYIDDDDDKDPTNFCIILAFSHSLTPYSRKV